MTNPGARRLPVPLPGFSEAPVELRQEFAQFLPQGVQPETLDEVDRMVAERGQSPAQALAP